MESSIFAIFPGRDQVQLNTLCADLLEEQKKNWPLLALAYAKLPAIHTRLLSCPGYEAYLQFNRARSVSSGAALDYESIKSRPCFLCTTNRPREQKGILYRQDYLILCNPAPAFARHFTVVHVQHQPQAIAVSIDRLLDLAADMSPDFIVFYNGPACGASAPDHLHFQAVPADALPLMQAFPGHFRIIKDTSVQIYQAQGIDRSALVLAGSDKDLLLRQFDRLIQAAQNIIPVSGEPLINVVCSFVNGVWRIMIFLRSRHRPDAFYLQGEQRIFVSPGTIEMTGVVITPVELNFNRLDCENIRNIYTEVSVSEDTLGKIIENL